MTVYIQGSFDILHIGHINILKRARKLVGNEGKVVVSVLTDEAYEAYRGYKPAMDFTNRMTAIESLRYVDEVIAGNNTKTKEEIEKVDPDYIVVGSDWAKKDIYAQYKITQEWLDEWI